MKGVDGEKEAPSGRAGVVGAGAPGKRAGVSWRRVRAGGEKPGFRRGEEGPVTRRSVCVCTPPRRHDGESGCVLALGGAEAGGSQS